MTDLLAVPCMAGTTALTVWVARLRLQAIADPFVMHPWGSPGITPADVRRAYERGHFQPNEPEKQASLGRRGADHVARIAHLMRQGWTDPLQLDVGIPELGDRPDQVVQDGFHRLAAAIVLDKPWVYVDIAGSATQARHLLGPFHQHEPRTAPRLSWHR